MIISFVVAIAEDGAMGKDNALPWNLPADLRHFKEKTLGKPIVMGRKSWESLGGKPLPKRVNIVLSSQTLTLPEGVLLYKNVAEVLRDFATEEEVCIIGGAQIFEASLSLANVLHLTRVHGKFPEADVFFPEINWEEWKMISEERHEADERHAYAFTFQEWEKVVSNQ